MHTLASALRKMFGVQLYKNNARALLSRILSILNLDWLQHAHSVRGVYEYVLAAMWKPVGLAVIPACSGLLFARRGKCMELKQLHRQSSCQQGDERTLTDFAFSSRFSLFFPLILIFCQFFTIRGGTLPPYPGTGYTTGLKWSHNKLIFNFGTL